MTIIIDGKVAAMKKKSSFDFVSENRYFSGADSYSFTITFPLKDCPQNLAIFGHINRKDVEVQKILFDCEIRSGKFCKRGSITITEMTEVEVKTQFLEGRSVQNYTNSFDDIYLNELTLGYPSTTPTAEILNNTLYKCIDDGVNYLALPWVNNNSGNIQNNLDASGGSFAWSRYLSGLSFQPYLLYLVQIICDHLGYTYDFSKWKESSYRYLLVCNAIPYAWEMQNWAAALPHWSLSEFFEQLEYFLNGEFTIDHEEKTISFAFTSQVLQTQGVVEIDKVIDEFSSSVEEASDCTYRECVNLKYTDCDHEMWNYYRCDWFIKHAQLCQKPFRWPTYYAEVESLSTLLSQMKPYTRTSQDYLAGGNDTNCIYYCQQEKMYVGFRKYSWTCTGHTDGGLPRGEFVTVPFAINQFGDSIVNEEADSYELKIVPAWIDDIGNNGQCIFLQLPDYGVDTPEDPNYGSNWDAFWANMEYWAPKTLKKGDQSSSGGEEFLDKLYVAFWDKNCWHAPYYPVPVIDTYTIYPDWACIKHDVSMRLRSESFTLYTRTRDIDPTIKYTFEFIADDVPNVRSLFLIHGQRFVAEKVTATFTEDGMSQKMKIDCYRVLD